MQVSEFDLQVQINNQQANMFKYVVFAALLALAVASPAPAPAPAPKPGVVAAAYSAPLLASAPLAYSTYGSYRYAPYAYSAYSAPLTYPYAYPAAHTVVY